MTDIFAVPASDDGRSERANATLKTLADDRALFFNHLSEGVIIAGADGKLLFVNQAAERLHGVKSLFVAPDHYSDTYHLFTEDGRPYPFEDLPLARAVMKGEKVIEERWRIRRPDGSEILAIGSACPLIDDGEQIGAILTLRDDSARFDAEQGLRDSEERYRTLFEKIEAGFCIIELKFDDDGRPVDYRFIEVNPAFTLQSGIVDAVGKWMTEIAPDQEQHWFDTYGKVVTEGVPIRFENFAAGLDNRWFDVHAFRTGPAEAKRVAVLFTDTTERKRADDILRDHQAELEARVEQEMVARAEAEAALRQSQKMETLGQLTGGIAHDFNNLLQIITGNLDILRRSLPSDSPRLQRSVDNAFKGAERAAILTQRLLAFSRRQPLIPKVLNANKLVAGMSELLHRALGETIAIETVLASGLWRVEADSNQLENALLNLAVNSRDAMPDGGKLTIETANTHLDRSYAEQNSGVLAGQYVVICVSDTGSGMDPVTAERAFDPFFTTKDVGKGTGLGLSMVYGFVKQSGGHLKIYTEQGEGTTVKIYLPRHHGKEADANEVAAADFAPAGLAGETILVCEDDDDVRAYSVQSLRELGYRVIEAADGPSTLRSLQVANGSVDLLFTDIVLPGGMTGAMVAEEARKLQPGLKVLFTTGYARNAIVHHGRVDPGVELLSKPFSYADLAARVRDLLDARPARD